VSVEAAERLRALVVDDEWAARDYLVELLHGSGLAQVVGALASAKEAREILHDGRVAPDVVFLDIRLSGGRNEGLEIARELAALPAPPMVVLATAFNAHAVEVYDIGVADYLLKPFTEQRVELCLQRLLVRRSGPRPAGPARIVARRHKSLVFFDSDEVWAFEAAERLTRVHSARGVFDVDLSLSAIEASIGRAFARVHRNWLVNVAHITEFERGGETRVWVGEGLVADGRGIHAPVARDRAQQLRDMLLASATGVRRTT
jgi:two-component system, LytTR family, response regulator LytT